MTDESKPGAATWQVIKLAYLAGSEVPVLAAQHGVTEACLRKRITREGWAQEKRQLTAAVTEQTVETCEKAAQRFRLEMCGEFDEWFALAARQRSKIKDGDFEALSQVANAFAKLYAAAFKHHGLEKKTEIPIIVPGAITLRPPEGGWSEDAQT